MDEFPKAYEPQEVEKRLAEMWDAGCFFEADPSSEKPPFCVILPPPNVTGVLHMGHALVDTIQDILVRYKRMQGFETLWMPGTDHAGISTQTVVEKHLIATEGKSRKEYDREEFLEKVWDWKEKSENHILYQLKELGCSCDWKRLRFTMDEGANRAVKTVFKKMYEEGLIYRGDYLVNWDPVTQTALADDEVEYEEREGHLYWIRYPLVSGDGHIVIATTRPETMLGDVAVAVAPKDPRYSKLIGKKLKLPIVDREIEIIADHYVDPAFGSGAVKITPAHDPNDYEIGMRHNLEMINILTPDGKVNGFGFEGMTIQDARHAIIKRLEKLGLIEKIEPHTHRVGLSYRSKAVIEPYLSKQWFVKMEPFKKPLIDAVKSGRVELIPKNWESTYFHWIENLRDWCISRQLWWGHRIPIWYKDDEMVCHIEDTPPGNGWVQDSDVLDTWFSSALWPFSTLGFPDSTDEIKKFYPTSTLVTGHDILFFWVARMLMMGEYVMGELPFKQTFLHGLIYGKSYWRQTKDGAVYLPRDESLPYDLGKNPPKDVHSKWEKMSKSKGNVIDPIEIIEQYGADAMRMSLAMSCTHARQIDLDRRRFEELKNFSNKIWNGARFVLMNCALTPDDLEDELIPKSLEDKWILGRLSETISQLNKHIDAYEFDKAAHLVYTFYWDEFCAYYVELCKPSLEDKTKQRVLLTVLKDACLMLHPFAPFITEELYQKLKERYYPNDPVSISIAPFPTPKYPTDKEVSADFAKAKKLVYAIRNMRGEMQIPPKTEIELYIENAQGDHTQLAHIIGALIRLKTIHFGAPKENTLSAQSTVDNSTITILLPEELREKELARLEKQYAKLTTQINSYKTKLANENFIKKAPQDLVNKTKQELQKLETELKAIETATKPAP